MVLGIDASNLKGGGGLTHLIELISNIEIENYVFDKIVVWGGNNLDKLPERNWLVKDFQPLLNKSFFYSSYWKVFKFSYLIEKYNCDILFCPGGYYFSFKHKYVSMSRNMLVFEETERGRFPFSATKIRYHILELLQRISFKKSLGNIFISKYAFNYISELVKDIKKKSFKIIHHGVSSRFSFEPKEQKPIDKYSESNPFKLLYISTVNYYKHQDTLIKVIDYLNEQSLPIELILVGGIHPSLENSFRKQIDGKNYITYAGVIDYNSIHQFYKTSDGFIFASTCENMPNILVEAMQSGLPIICSNFGPMPEILKNGGFYFDPTSKTDTTNVIQQFVLDVKLREDKVKISHNLAQNYNWQKCAKETMEYLESLAIQNS